MIGYEYWIISGLVVLLFVIFWLVYEVIQRKKTLEANESIWRVVLSLKGFLGKKMLKYVSVKEMDMRSRIELIDFTKYVNSVFDGMLSDKKESDVKSPRKGKAKKKVDKWDYFGK